MNTTPHAALPDRIDPVAITAYTAVSAVGRGREAHRRAAADGRSGLVPNDVAAWPLETQIGRVDGLDAVALPPGLARWDCRNHRLGWLGLEADGFAAAVAAARERIGGARIAVVMGTSTSSIGATEDAYRALDAEGRFAPERRSTTLHTPHSLATFVQEALDLAGPCLTVSTACSSSAKAFAVAERMLRQRLVDAVVVGGVDTLCGSVLFGFNALQLVSPRRCRPFDADRDGINLGEAAGFALLERADESADAFPRLVGHGESSDAHHMSSPHPEGLGAERALDAALVRAGLDAHEIEHINLHGTASRKNDEVEAALVARRFPASTHACSTKGLTGHTLGTAGVLEAVFVLQAIETGSLPGTANATRIDPACGPQVRLDPVERAVRLAASHSFGFGGTNCVLIFGPAARGRDARAP